MVETIRDENRIRKMRPNKTFVRESMIRNARRELARRKLEPKTIVATIASPETIIDDMRLESFTILTRSL